MADNVHPAVTLIVERMKSHPDEFMAGLEPPGQLGAVQPRWGKLLERMDPWLTPVDRAYLDQHFRALAMERIHHDVLDELLNGPERRAEEQRRIISAQAQQAQLARQALSQQAYQAQAQAQRYTVAQGQLGSGIIGTKATSIIVDELKNDSVLDALGRYIPKLGGKK